MDTPRITYRIETAAAFTRTCRRRRIKIAATLTAFAVAIAAPSPIDAFASSTHHTAPKHTTVKP